MPGLTKGDGGAKLYNGRFNDELDLIMDFYDMDTNNGKLLLCLPRMD